VPVEAEKLKDPAFNLKKAGRTEDP
jgi:hypothetical protein